MAPRDYKLLRTTEVRKLKEAYREKYGEMFIPFNYADFRSTKDKLAAEVYIDTLRSAIESDTPYRVESKRYSTFDH